MESVKRNLNGSNNPNWKGGPFFKKCTVCEKEYQVMRLNSTSRFCSSKCYGESQKGVTRTKNQSKYSKNTCLVCNVEYEVYACHAHKIKTCSVECSRKYRSIISSDDNNSNWKGGISRMPYPYNWADISKSVRERDGNSCMNPKCTSQNSRIVVHHIDYDKTNCNQVNLITVCEACNSIANFGRNDWYEYYMDVQTRRGVSCDDSIPKAKLIKEPNTRKGSKHPMRKLLDQDIYEIRSYLSIFNLRGAQRKIASLFGVSEASISKIFNGKSWT